MTVPALHNTGVLYRRILSHFPQDITLAFAYGSGVFKHHGSSQGQMEKNMLDFVFAVDDPVTWHTMNLLQNRKHYSILKLLGPKTISSIQSDHGAAVYYNTLVPVDGRTIKYGVISTQSLMDDLMHWNTLYVAGRLHKPVKMLVQSENGSLRAALVSNLKSAVTASFLMLPESFTEEELFLQIAGLSYAGDFRMVFGEDRSKVSNIVRDNMQHFKTLYSNILHDCPLVVYKSQQAKLEVRHSEDTSRTMYTRNTQVLQYTTALLLLLLLLGYCKITFYTHVIQQRSDQEHEGCEPDVEPQQKQKCPQSETPPAVMSSLPVHLSRGSGWCPVYVPTPPCGQDKEEDDGRGR
ncbi:phosphatidate cytidylyltransferase, mitochondrial-like [Cynoglossus semilaevis]|uniref:phosphatidate cytidylyltransferase, mitochondrial-like n=1 Tax=Cynoglossus semilaevis TaxID=244447 RepID=UPI000D629461|nr:phosphatidate cytidylyltransferase, mitochondrial-like [Cynoglossus semilaevis]